MEGSIGLFDANKNGQSLSVVAEFTEKSLE